MKGLGTVAGVPDLVILHQGRTFELELKVDGKKATARQLETHVAMRGRRCRGRGRAQRGAAPARGLEFVAGAIVFERTAAISTGYAHCIIDVEMQSGADLPEVGASRYAADPTTTVLVVGFAIDDEPVELWYPDQAPLPERLAEVAVDPEVRFIAHNASFEIEIARKILTPRYGMPEIALERWVCTMTTASALAMPPDLEKLALALGLETKKNPIGKRLMRRCRAPLPPGHDDSDRLLALGEYCQRDVEALARRSTRCRRSPRRSNACGSSTQRINGAGVPFDRPLVDRGARNRRARST